MNFPSLRWSLDLLACALLAVLVPVLATTGQPPVLYPILAGLLVIAAPGYALLAVLYPARAPETDWRPEFDLEDLPALHRDRAGTERTPRESLAPLERLLFTPVVSAALVGCVLVVVEFTPLSLSSWPILLSLSATTLLLSGVAAVRRVRRPPASRGGVAALDRAVAAARDQFSIRSKSPLSPEGRGATSRRVVALNLLVVVAALAAIAGGAGLLAADTAGQEFTEFYVVGQNESGAYLVDEVPEQLATGEEETVYLGVTNQHGSDREYTVVATVQYLDRTANGTVVQSERRLATFDRSVSAGETVRIPHRLSFDRPGLDVRVRYMLYAGEAPADPSPQTADETLRLRLAVVDEA
jgi:uncharacterized membrane protein